MTIALNDREESSAEADAGVRFDDLDEEDSDTGPEPGGSKIEGYQLWIFEFTLVNGKEYRIGVFGEGYVDHLTRFHQSLWALGLSDLFLSFTFYAGPE